FEKETQDMENSVKIIQSFNQDTDELNELISNTEEWHDYIVTDVIEMFEKDGTQAYENLLNADTYVGALVEGYERFASESEAKIFQFQNEIADNGQQPIT